MKVLDKYLGGQLTDIEREELKDSLAFLMSEGTKGNRDLAKRIAKNYQNHAKIIIDERAAKGGGGAFLFPQHDLNPTVVLHSDLKDNPYVMAHELGHAKFQESALGKLTQNKITNYMYGLQGLSFIPAMYPTTNKARILTALVTQGIATAPKLISEHTAWNEAEKMLREQKANETQLNELKMLKDRALGTYYTLPKVTLGLSALALGYKALLSGINKTSSLSSITAAWNAYNAQQEYEKAQAFVATRATQPYMREISLNGGISDPQPVHHRRHRHHHS